MDTYNFTYRRVKESCLHCDKLKQRSYFKKALNSIFNKKRLKAEAKAECELEWKSLEVIGHGPENFTESTTSTKDGKQVFESIDSQNRDRMVLYFKNGALRTISDWFGCELKLETDWVLFTKNKMEKESGQDVKLAVDTGS